MARIKTLLKRAGQWEYTWIILLLLVVMGLHFAIIYQPTDLVFDEKHYVEDARTILQGQSTGRPEHPPLGKLFVVLGILSFGDNPLGWRFFPIIFGAAGVLLFYLICRRLELSRWGALLAAFLLATENMSFVQASVAMLDVFMVTFMLLAFWLYLKGYYAISGVAIALSMLVKLSGILAILVIVLHWLITRRGKALPFAVFLLAAYASFWVLQIAFNFAEYHKFVDPIQNTWSMLSLSGSLTFGNVIHPFASRPWEWVLKPLIMPYWYVPHYVGAVSFTVWALIIPSVLYMVFRVIKGSNAALFAGLWFASTYLLWLPLTVLTNRISYVFYIYPTIGAVLLGLGLGFSQLLPLAQRLKRRYKWPIIAFVVLFLLGHVGILIVLTPLSSWWQYPIPPS